jgi:hypothetical protein
MTDPVRRRLSARAHPRALLLALLLPVLALTLTGCALQFHGAAVIPSAGPSGTAQLTVDWRLQDFDASGGIGRLRSTYSDPNAVGGRVAFRTTEAIGFSLEGLADNCMSAPIVPYTSLVNGNLGTGLLSIFACDNGPYGEDDTVSITIYSGPFDGYENDTGVITGDFRAPVPGGGGGGGGGGA